MRETADPPYLQRLRLLIEGQQVETGAWRGEIKDGADTSAGPTS